MILDFIKNIKILVIGIFEFFLCLLSTRCKYSIKKTFAFFFLGLIIYLTFTGGSIEMINSFLLFLAGLLAIRSFDKTIKSKEPEI